MSNQAYSIDELAGCLHRELMTNRYPADERGGVYKPTDRPVNRLGLVLDLWPGLSEWVTANELDAIWIHRPWSIDLTTFPEEVGILYNHLPFDEALTMGYNPRLANSIGALGEVEPLGYKPVAKGSEAVNRERPIGMLFDTVTKEFDAVLMEVNQMFSGYDRAEAGRCLTREHAVSRIAVVGAMNDALIREAADRGANLYLTGQYRKGTQPAVDKTGIAVIAVGHRRSEEWGLRALADLLYEQYPALSITMPAPIQQVYEARHKS